MPVTRENGPKCLISTTRMLRAAFRLAVLLLHALLGLVAQLGLRVAAELVPIGHLESTATRLWHQGVCRLIGLRIQAVGAHLVVSNHISWLDIPVLGATLPVCFLSKAEVRRWPLLGMLATMAHTVYIERGAHGAWVVSEQIVARLRRGRNVVLFPEGTTSDGRSVRRFMPRLFAAAIATESSVQPVAIRYSSVGDVESVAPFFGGDRMGPHMLKVLAEPSIDVQVTFCPPIHEIQSRGRLTELSREAIRVVIEQDLSN
jgi:1-acyl-sn-glycerol-3-phosphate acyltransferase